MTDSTDRRRLILAAAERLLEHYGLNKTTVADIAREAAIGVGTVYLEFGSKDDIIGHVASGKHTAILQHLESVAASEGPAHVRLRQLLAARVRLFVELSSCGTHAPELVHCTCDPVQHSWRAYQRAERELVAGLLASDEFAVDDPHSMAVTVLDAYAAYTPPWTRRPDFAELEARVGRMHDLVLRGLRK